MNVFKSPVLNGPCLRNKIEELSPLQIRQSNVGICNKDTLFHATWSYYASGCQERLTSIRRRIEQNAKIVAPTGGPRTQLCKNREFVSCFRSEEKGSAKAKNTPKRFTAEKGLGSVQYSTPEQWKSWKREEREVRQILMHSKDPYRAEELTKKLKQLRKLTNRHPLIKLPSSPEEPIKPALKKIKKRSSFKHLKQPEVPKPGPYVNRSSNDGNKSTTKEASKSSLIELDMKHSSTESVSSSRRSKNLSKSSLAQYENPKSPRMSFKSEFLQMLQAFEFKDDKVENQSEIPKDPVLPIDSLLFLPYKLHKSKEKATEPKPSRFNLKKNLKL
ncbi:hypothetical protein KR038_011976 [Drosophila bunnanda]|nr:hypothetical protein KR038_011976 [Drosophila bunnanda]